MNNIFRTTLILLGSLIFIILFEFLLAKVNFYNPTSFLAIAVPFLILLVAVILVMYGDLNLGYGWSKLTLHGIIAGIFIAVTASLWLYIHYTNIHPHLVDMEIAGIAANYRKAGLDEKTVMEIHEDLLKEPHIERFAYMRCLIFSLGAVFLSFLSSKMLLKSFSK